MIATALNNLRPNSQWSLNGDLVWTEITNEQGVGTGKYEPFGLIFHDNTVCPSKEELDAEVARLEAEYVSNEYQRLRKPEYPPISDLADAIYHQANGDDTKMTAYLAAVEEIKQKYPKV
jgi:hypothetical protein